MIPTTIARLNRWTIPCLLAIAPLAAQPNVNLLANAGFETGSLSPWTIHSGNAALSNYGSPDMPTPSVATAIGGGGVLLRDLSGGAWVEQVVSSPVIPSGASLIVEGYLGGSQDDARLSVTFLNAGGAPIGTATSEYVTHRNRNFETVLLYRSIVTTVPLATDSFVVRVEFRDATCCQEVAAADNISATLVTGSTLPAAFPLDTEMVVNHGFEFGWNGTSPLNLIGPGWEILSGDSSYVAPYSSTVANAPTPAVSCLIDGAAPNPPCNPFSAGNYLGHVNNCSLTQRIDVRGNTSQFNGSIALLASAYLGGSTTENDTASVDYFCRNGSGTALATASLEPVTSRNRSFAPILMRREHQIPIPAGTEFIDVVVTFNDNSCCGDRAFADNISAKLVNLTPPPPVALQTNLVSNSDFESGSLAGLPQQLTNPASWHGESADAAYVQVYGTAGAPTLAFAQANGLGGQLLRDGDDSVLRQRIDLRGSQALIASGSMGMQASAWLGGYLNDNDTAEVRVSFRDLFGAVTGVMQVLPPVTAVDRGGQTILIQRTSPPFTVPNNAAEVVIDVVFDYVNCCARNGLADDVRLVAFDLNEESSAAPFAGTGGDIVLRTGVNEIPTTGIGNYIKQADAGDVLWIQAGSPMGTLSGSLLLLGVNAFPNSAPSPTPIIPGIALDPSAVALLTFGGPLFPPLLASMPVGNQLSLVIPPTLANTSLLLQAVCFPFPGQPVPPNGIFFSSAGHLIE